MSGNLFYNRGILFVNNIENIPLHIKDTHLTHMIMSKLHKLIYKNIIIPSELETTKLFNKPDMIKLFQEILYGNKKKGLTTPTIDEKIELVYDRFKTYNTTTIPIHWKIVNPDSQIAGSYNPAVVTSKEWYGRYFNETDLISISIRNKMYRTEQNKLECDYDSESDIPIKLNNNQRYIVRSVVDVVSDSYDESF